MSSTVVVNPNPTAQPTDGNSVNNIQVYITGGHGGPHAVFDKDHYKSQIRIDGELVEYNALQGALTGLGYVWSINVIAIGDNNGTRSLSWPMPANLKAFVQQEMQYLIEQRYAKKIYLATAKVLVDIDNPPQSLPWN